MNHGDLHELSLAIGELRQAASVAKEMRDRLETKLDRITTSVSEIKRDVDAMKHRGLGILIGLSLASSMVGAKVSSALQKYFP